MVDLKLTLLDEFFSSSLIVLLNFIHFSLFCIEKCVIFAPILGVLEGMVPLLSLKFASALFSCCFFAWRPGTERVRSTFGLPFWEAQTSHYLTIPTYIALVTGAGFLHIAECVCFLKKNIQ